MSRKKVLGDASSENVEVVSTQVENDMVVVTYSDGSTYTFTL